MRISDWSSDVCSSDLVVGTASTLRVAHPQDRPRGGHARRDPRAQGDERRQGAQPAIGGEDEDLRGRGGEVSTQVCRSEEHTSEIQSIMRISYAVICLKKKNKNIRKVNNKSKSQKN